MSAPKFMSNSHNQNQLIEQRMLWKGQSLSIPNLKGGKSVWFSLVVELVQKVGEDQAFDLEIVPSLESSKEEKPWRYYARFLCVSGLTKNVAGKLKLTENGEAFRQDPKPTLLADLFQKRFRLFGETAQLLAEKPTTLNELNDMMHVLYKTNWKTKSPINTRIDWLEVLGLVQALGEHKWGITNTGQELLSKWVLVSPQAINDGTLSAHYTHIEEPPPAIAALLAKLEKNPQYHIERSTYNIWVPSPNKINNLREIVEAALEPINRKDLIDLIQKRFSLKASSVESMMPFLKIMDLLEEVQRNVYQASSIAKAWLISGNDLDFIRILHAKMRFVGEMLKAAVGGLSRNEIYTISKMHGQESVKTKWIASFLLEAGLLEEPQYLYLRTTQLGSIFYQELPLADTSVYDSKVSSKEDNTAIDDLASISKLGRLRRRLQESSKNPMAEGKQSGVAFEEAIAEVFNMMGFNARKIGGPGDTDVIVQWENESGNIIKAIIDGKSKSSGGVSHNDISDVAIENHKSKNKADYVAIVGRSFSGKTIRDYARKKSVALITGHELLQCLDATEELGLSTTELSMLFMVPNGLTQLFELIEKRRRELRIISAVVQKFKEEQTTLGALSTRDLHLLFRDAPLNPSDAELNNALKTLSNPSVGVLRSTSNKPMDERSGFLLRETISAANRLHALAKAIEVDDSSFHRRT